MNVLGRLQMWYQAQCNGTWEHSSGIRIESCDNPGWWVKIDLSGTSLQDRAYTEVSDGVDGQRFPLGSQWMSCRVEANMWHGAGDETKLESILDEFLRWAER